MRISQHSWSGTRRGSHPLGVHSRPCDAERRVRGRGRRPAPAILRDVSPSRRLLGYLLRYRRDFLIGLGCVVVTTGVALTTPMVLRYAIDDLTRGVTRAKLVEYGGLLLIIGVVGGAFRFLMRRVLIGTSRHIEYDLRNDFFAHLERLPPTYQSYLFDRGLRVRSDQ